MVVAAGRLVSRDIGRSRARPARPEQRLRRVRCGPVASTPPVDGCLAPATPTADRGTSPPLTGELRGASRSALSWLPGPGGHENAGLAPGRLHWSRHLTSSLSGPGAPLAARSRRRVSSTWSALVRRRPEGAATVATPECETARSLGITAYRKGMAERHRRGALIARRRPAAAPEDGGRSPIRRIVAGRGPSSPPRTRPYVREPSRIRAPPPLPVEARLGGRAARPDVDAAGGHIHHVPEMARPPSPPPLPRSSEMADDRGSGGRLRCHHGRPTHRRRVRHRRGSLWCLPSGTRAATLRAGSWG